MPVNDCSDPYELLEMARRLEYTPAEKEKQRRSFAFGNLHLSNPNITRADIDRAADELDEKQRNS